jgi:hypothetical protein
MVRVVIFVIALLGLFAGMLVYGGDRLGAWDDAEPPPPSNQQPITRPDEPEDKDKDEDADPGSAAPVASDPVPPDKARWIRQTNALCLRAYEETEQYDQPESLGEAERLLVELQGKNREYNDAFAAIRPAKGDEREVALVVELFDKDERLVAALITAVRNGDAGALLELNERLAAVAQQEADLLVGLGATDCGIGLLGTAY